MSSQVFVKLIQKHLLDFYFLYTVILYLPRPVTTRHYPTPGWVLESLAGHLRSWWNRRCHHGCTEFLLVLNANQSQSNKNSTRFNKNNAQLGRQKDILECQIIRNLQWNHFINRSIIKTCCPPTRAEMGRNSNTSFTPEIFQNWSSTAATACSFQCLITSTIETGAFPHIISISTKLPHKKSEQFVTLCRGDMVDISHMIDAHLAQSAWKP